MSSARERALCSLLDAVVVGRVDAWLSANDDAEPVDAWDGALRVLALLLTLRWAEGSRYAAGLTDPGAGDPDAHWLLAATTAWAAAGDPSPSASDALGPTREGEPPDPASVTGRFAGYVLVEAALAHARLDLSQQVADRLGAELWQGFAFDGVLHDFSTMAVVCRTRLLAFRGDIAEAAAARRSAMPVAEGPLAALLAATACLVVGNQADRQEVRRLTGVVDATVADSRELTAAGCQMLAAFGLIAVGEVAEAARRVLVAGGDADLSRLDVIDRALGLELLVALAVAEEHLDDAEVWRDRAASLLASPIADSTVARINSRVALLAGRVDEAVAWGERAVERALETERRIEQAEGEIVLSRARIEQRGPGDRAAATSALQLLVAEAERRGHLAARTAAKRELRPLGVRLRPVAGSGWLGLSSRESEVARLVVRGSTNRQVASRLHLSEHTVRVHVSRVLAAFGVATRSGLPAAVSAARGDFGPTPLAAPQTRAVLTRRQHEVAGLVAEGLGNAAIAQRLSLSQRTVEKHVGEILARWGLGGRTAIAHAVTEQRTTSGTVDARW